MTTDQLPPRPPAAAAPKFRYWGDRKPPQNLAEPRVSTAEDNPTKATLRLYGPIDPWGGFWGVSAKEVSAALDQLPDTVTELQLRINSPGGDAWEGLAISNLLRAHPVNVIGVVDGLAASAASFIAAGCDETVMSPGTQMMVHDAKTFAYGPAAEMTKTAEFLDVVSDSLASLYAEAAGGTTDAWRAVMREETWYTAEEAVSAKLAQRVGVVVDNSVAVTAGGDPADPAEDPLEGDPEDVFDLAALYAYAGRSHAPAPAVAATATKPPVASAPGSPPEGEGAADVLNDEQTTDLRHKLGLPEDADGATILAALDEALEERADAPPDRPTAGAPEGTVLVDAEVLAQLQAGAAAGAAARQQQVVETRDNTIRAAIRDGRITKASSEKWATRWDADPDGTAEVLASLPAGLVPLDELGHTNPGNQTGSADVDDVAYLALFPDEQKVG